jgi:hypothetical protein
MTVRRRIGFVLLLLILGLPTLSAQSAADVNPAQRTFNGDSFKHPVELPEKVLDALVAAKQAEYARDWAKENPGKDLNRFFAAIPIHLSDSDEQDYIVFGQFPLTGADCNWFWVVHSTNSHPRAVLWSNGNTLQLLPDVHNRLPDIRVDWWSANGDGYARIFRFNGVRYSLIHRFDTQRKMN